MPFSLFRAARLQVSTLQATKRHYRQRLLNFVLSGLTFVNIAYLLLSLLDGEHDLSSSFNLILLVAPAVLLVMLWFNVQGWTAIIGPTCVVFIGMAVFATTYFEQETSYVDDFLYYHIIGMVLSRFLLSPRLALLYIGAIFAGIGWMALYYGSDLYLDLLNVITFLAFSMVVFMALIEFLQRLENARQVELEKQIRSQEQLLQTAFDGVLLVDDELKVIEASAAFARLLGYSADAVLQDKSVFLDDLPSPAQGHWTDLFEMRARHANGNILYFEATYRTEGTHLLMAVRDVSEQWEQKNLLIQRADYFSALHETALALMHFQDHAQILTRILRYATTLVGTTHGFVALFEDRQQQVRVRAATGVFTAHVSTVVPLHSYVVKQVQSTRQPLMVDDFASWNAAHEPFNHIKIHAFVAVPLLVQQDLRGFIGIAHHDDHERFSQEDIEVLRQFADLASLSLANTQLYADLRRNQQMLNAIIENTTDAIYIKTKDGRYLLFNPASEHTYGVSAEHILDHYDYEVFQPELLEQINHVDQLVLQNGFPHTYEFDIVAEGAEQVYLTTKFPYLAADGGVQGVVAMSRDITAMKQAERVLRRSEAYYRALIDNALDIILIVSRQGYVRFMSPSMERNLGYSSEDLENISILELVHPDDLQRLIKRFIRIRHNEIVRPIECRIRHQDGSWRVFELAAIDRTDSEISAGYIINARDISERKHAEVQLQRHLTALQSLHEASLRLYEAPNLDAVLDALLASTADVFPRMSGATIHLFNAKSNKLEPERAFPRAIMDGSMSFSPGQGTAGLAYRQQTVIRVNNTWEDTRFLQDTLHPNAFRSILIVPLLSRDEALGTLSIIAREEDAFDHNDEIIADMLARQTAVLLERVQRFDEEQRQRRFSEALYKLSFSLNSAMTLDDLFEQVLFHVLKSIPSDAANIMLLDEEQRIARMVRHYGYEGRDSEFSVDFDFELQHFHNLNHIFKARSPLTIANTVEDSRWRTGLTDDGYWIRSYAGAPIVRGDKVIGFLNLDSAKVAHFSEADTQRLMAFANQIGVAIEKVGLIESEQQQREISDTLRDIANTLTRTTRRDELLQRFLEQVARLIPYDAAGIWIVDDVGRSHFLAGKGHERFGVRETVETTVHDPETDELMKQVVETKQVVIISDTTGMAWTQGDFSYIRSWACSPILVRGKFYGKLALDNTHKGFYQPHHIPVLETLAKQLSIALENVSLFEQVQNYAALLEHRVAERTAELEHERLQLQTILASMDEGVIYTDYRDGDECPTIQYVNASLSRLLGIASDQLVGKQLCKISDRILDDDDDPALQFFLDPVNAPPQPERSEWRGEVQLETETQGTIECAMTVLTVNVAEKNQIWAVAVIRDISMEKALQAQRERFVANASHELRTPLTNLVTRMYLLKNQPDKADTHIRVMERTIERLTTLAEDLLDITRYDNHVIRIDPDVHDLSAVIKSVVELQLASAQFKGIQLESTLPEETILVMIDENRFHQVITNLLVNAINYTHKDTVVHVYVSATHDTAIVCVEDNGTGIAPEQLKHIFEPFFRATEGRVNGTGLGLTIAKEIVDLHGGHIWAESEVDRGSRFYVQLPRHYPS